MRVAFATTNGTTIDQHFGRAAAFAIYEVTGEAAQFVETLRTAEGDIDIAVVETRGMGGAHDDAIETKIDSLGPCKIVYFTEIGGPSAAKLVRRGVMPLKVDEGSPIDATLEALMERVRTNPAPWMRKALASECDAGGQGSCTCSSGTCC
ncbi:MAG: dinitrogenase iron-molybdenum cofactor biosynthesis protein [Actinobacteria bacterium HGW-Actinobacteria-1]|jgi:nitrogen fixation protein NifX|nr:MAG: dinitrogenase iron-molybdenum cofactor biosynthesis protein [Actinobacteria bacterium HGW-Actinobacteria-1]